MNQTIWKYQLEIDDEVETTMPLGAEILCVQMQGKVPCIWALVDPTNPLVNRKFVWYGTGNPAEGAHNHPYVGTIQYNGLVFHLFEATIVIKV